jgi:hypothetical protein
MLALDWPAQLLGFAEPATAVLQVPAVDIEAMSVAERSSPVICLMVLLMGVVRNLAETMRS